jgi:hypothetical protein
MEKMSLLHYRNIDGQGKTPTLGNTNRHLPRQPTLIAG